MCHTFKGNNVGDVRNTTDYPAIEEVPTRVLIDDSYVSHI